MKLETPQDGWNAAMLYISKWCFRAESVAARGPALAAAFEEAAILAENLIDTPPSHSDATVANV